MNVKLPARLNRLAGNRLCVLHYVGSRRGPRAMPGAGENHGLTSRSLSSHQNHLSGRGAASRAQAKEINT